MKQKQQAQRMGRRLHCEYLPWSKKLIACMSLLPKVMIFLTWTYSPIALKQDICHREFLP